jgi:hypothetical protein
MLFFEDEIVRAGSSNGVVFEVWRGSARGQHFRDLGKKHIDYALTQPDKKAALFSVVQMSSFPNFDGEARKELEARTQKTKPYVRASVVILPSNGFAASVVRGILMGLMRLTRDNVPTEVFSSSDEGCTWLAPRLPAVGGRAVVASELLDALKLVAGP